MIVKGIKHLILDFGERAMLLFIFQVVCCFELLLDSASILKLRSTGESPAVVRRF